MLVRIKQNAGNLYAGWYLRNSGGDHQSAMLASQLTHWLSDHIGEIGEIKGLIQPGKKENTVIINKERINYIPGYCLEYADS